MQRWWYGDDNEKPVTLSRSPVKNRSRPSSVRKWKFQAIVKSRSLEKDETLAITGDCEALGQWAPQDVVIMSPNAGEWNLRT